MKRTVIFIFIYWVLFISIVYADNKIALQLIPDSQIVSQDSDVILHYSIKNLTNDTIYILLPNEYEKNSIIALEYGFALYAYSSDTIVGEYRYPFNLSGFIIPLKVVKLSGTEKIKGRIIIKNKFLPYLLKIENSDIELTYSIKHQAGSYRYDNRNSKYLLAETDPTFKKLVKNWEGTVKSNKIKILFSD